MRKVTYRSTQRATSQMMGMTEVFLVNYADDRKAVASTVMIGRIQIEHKVSRFHALECDGTEIGIRTTKSQAGEALKKHRDRQSKVVFEDILPRLASAPSESEAVEETTKKLESLSDMLRGSLNILTRKDAAVKLGITTDALRKRIARGTVKMVTSGGRESTERTDYVKL